MKKIIIVIAVLGAAAALYFILGGGGSNGAVSYKTAKADKGTVIKIVTSSGVVQPLQQVQVGTQVTGPVKKLYVDFNSRVKEGDIIAQIDPASYEARVAQDRASLARSIAEAERVEANLTQAENEFKRAQELAQKELISQSELDTAVASYDSLIAQLKLAKAGIEQSQAALKMSEINLAYTTIKSPIDGIVVSRNVDEGQTVAASLSAPTLFVIANNLNKIQIQASVAEADIGKISLDQAVNFTVDAYPEQRFSGRVAQIRLSPTTTQNVVTYTVIIYADNPEEKLLPGMTANLSFEVDKHANVLRVPNAALRFVPQDADKYKTTETAEANKEQAGANTESRPQGDPAGRSPDSQHQPGMGRRTKEKTETSVRKQIWTLSDGTLKPISVKVGITDGSFTEILNGDIKEGQEVVTGTITKEESAATNPFMPQRTGFGRR
ncbi:MAG: efflux RND transporter periplasmic adaptor subunit [Planctomycetes bacterium]|nr:efflux RND transporter periplasmic adaptor subunit [Planctomycetota bacterium]